MDDIYKIQNNLYIGAYWPRLNFDKIKRAEITAIINLMDENLYKPPESYAYLYKGFPDETYVPHDFLRDIFAFMDKHLIDNKGKVLVHCAMGISRSGGIIVGWLLKEHPDWNWEDAMDYVSKKRQIYPALEIKNSILDYIKTNK
ncbi:MAG: dual specificity protein phosphatase family protein [Promethearchaeia archaeon]